MCTSSKQGLTVALGERRRLRVERLEGRVVTLGTDEPWV